MKYELSKPEKSVVTLTVTLSATDWANAIENAYNAHKADYKVEGFRKGHAPRKIIETTYGPTVFYEDALGDSFDKAYIEALSKNKDVEPIDTPNLSVQSMDEKTGVVIVAKIPVMPEMKLGKYTGLGVNVQPKAVTEADVKHELEHVREHNVRFVEVKEPSKIGHTVNIDFTGFVGNEKFDGGTATSYDLELGSHSFIEGFEDQLVGKVAGDKVDVNVTFPENYQEKSLAGKKAVFKVVLNSVKARELPELNDAFASDTSEFETLDAYKEHLKEHLQEHANEDARIKTENEIIDKIVEGSQVEVPSIMVDNELNNMMQDLSYKLMYQGATLDQYASYLNTTVDKLKEERRKDALKGVKVRLALQQIIKNEKLGVESSEVDAKIKEMANSAKKSIKEYKESLNSERLNYIKNDILMSKLLNFLIENNK